MGADVVTDSVTVDLEAMLLENIIIELSLLAVQFS